MTVCNCRGSALGENTLTFVPARANCLFPPLQVHIAGSSLATPTPCAAASHPNARLFLRHKRLDTLDLALLFGPSSKRLPRWSRSVIKEGLYPPTSGIGHSDMRRRVIFGFGCEVKTCAQKLEAYDTGRIELNSPRSMEAHARDLLHVSPLVEEALGPLSVRVNCRHDVF